MAGNRNITIYSGDTYVHELRLKDSSNTAINISGRDFSGQIRLAPASDDAVANFSVNISNAQAGTVQFYLTPEETNSIAPGTYYYDFQQIDGVIVITLLTGKAFIQGDVTYVS